MILLRKTLVNESFHLDRVFCSITEYSFILWESHLNFFSNDNLLKHNLIVVWWRDKIHNAALLGRMSVPLLHFLLISMIDHHGELKLCTSSFNPSVTVIQSLRTHLSLILAAVSKPINLSKIPSLLLAWSLK